MEARCDGEVISRRLDRGKSFSRMVLAAFVFLIAMAASPLGAAVEGQGAGSTEEIRGKTTLAEIEKEYQVPAAFLIERLKLPKETGLNEPLKDLKDRHGFEMETVRTLVRDHQTGKDLAKVEAAVAAGGASAGKQTEHKGHQPAAVSTVAMMLALYAFFCIVMLLLLRKNRVGQGVRLAVLAVSLLVFGVLFKSQTEPVRAISQVFQALGMGRYGVLDTLLVFLAFTLMTLVGVKLICGWGCPAGTLQEVLYHLPWFAKIKKRRAPFWLSNALRIVLFIVFLIFVFGWIPGFRDQSIYRYFNPFKLFEWNFNVTAPITIAVIFALSMIHYRVYCLWICPFGLFSWLIQDASIFRVRVNHGTCIDCGKCVRACPTDAAKGIYEGKAIKVDCFSCARCLTACPNGSLQYRSWEGDKDQSDQA